MAGLIDLNGLGHFKAKENAMVADTYSASKTYAVGDYVYYNGTLYRCTTAITTTEAWTAAHWTAAKLADDCSSLKTAFNELVVISETEPTSENNKIWVDSNATSVQVPTYDDLIAVYPTETLTDQSTATFTDGADGIPMKSLIADIVNGQSGSDTPSPTNIRPITGWTGANIYVSDADTSDPTTYAIDWTTEAGTVYGGTINVTTGVLTVTTAFETFNSSTGFTKINFAPAYRYTKTLTYIAKREGVSYDFVASNMFDIRNGSSDYTQGKIISDNRMDFRLPLSTEIDTVAKLNTFLASTPLQVVYELETPITYQLSAQNVATLLGTNNVWANTGNINTLTYRADIALYIAKVITNA